MKSLVALTMVFVSVTGNQVDSVGLLQLKKSSTDAEASSNADLDCFARKIPCGFETQASPEEFAAPPPEFAAHQARPPPAKQARPKPDRRPSQEDIAAAKAAAAEKMKAAAAKAAARLKEAAVKAKAAAANAKRPRVKAKARKFAKRLSAVATMKHDKKRGLSKCKWSSDEMSKDCTNKDMFEFKLGVKDKFKAPSYAADEYGEDESWRTFSAEDEAEGWSGACVAYAKTRGKSCKHWCKTVQNMECVRGMDDAHHQTAQLSRWLHSKDYKIDPRYGGCTLLPGGHNRKSTANNGCDQGWGTQICACK